MTRARLARAPDGFNPDLVTRRVETVDVPPSRRLRVAIVADTHSAPHAGALTVLRREAPAVILHAGDIGDFAVLDALARVARVIAVRGNIDPSDGPPDTVDVELRDGAALLSRLLLMHIAVRGPRLTREALALARAREAQAVVCGHSHVPLIAASDGVAVFNPGSIGPRRFSLPITLGILEVAPGGLHFRHVDCETGADWRPGG